MNEIEEYALCIQHAKKELLQSGENLSKPTEGSICTVVIHVTSGQTPGEPKFTEPTELTITIGNGDEVFDKVLEYCVSIMSVNEESSFFIPGISFHLNLKLKLCSCIFKPYIFQMSDGMKYEVAKMFKQQGVELTQQRRFAHAFHKFKKSLQYILCMKLFYPSKTDLEEVDGDGSYSFDVEEVVSTRVSLYNNLAFCQLHYKNYAHVIPLCSKSIVIEPSVKAYYRRALAHIETMEYEKAERDLKDLLKIEPNNKAAIDKLVFVRNLDKNNRENYKSTIKKMFV